MLLVSETSIIFIKTRRFETTKKLNFVRIRNPSLKIYIFFFILLFNTKKIDQLRKYWCMYVLFSTKTQIIISKAAPFFPFCVVWFKKIRNSPKLCYLDDISNFRKFVKEIWNAYELQKSKSLVILGYCYVTFYNRLRNVKLKFLPANTA